MLLYGDEGERSLWDDDAAKSLAQMASPQRRMVTPPPRRPHPHMSIPPNTILRSILTPQSAITTLHEPPAKDPPIPI